VNQPQSTPEDVRAAIAANPQSQSDRSYLIRTAVDLNMADEIPDDWTIEYYDPDVGADDDEDLIADTYRFSILEFANGAGIPVELSINAHESGNMSISMPPNQQPITVFDITSADRLIDMLTMLRDINSGAYRGEIPASTTEPDTGITVYYPVGSIVIEPYRFMAGNDVQSWTTGLTAMANAAETYGPERGD
jgi:hypothetical protein